jgi:hypothetical protein
MITDANGHESAVALDLSEWNTYGVALKQVTGNISNVNYVYGNPYSTVPNGLHFQLNKDQDADFYISLADQTVDFNSAWLSSPTTNPLSVIEDTTVNATEGSPHTYMLTDDRMKTLNFASYNTHYFLTQSDDESSGTSIEVYPLPTVSSNTTFVESLTTTELVLNTDSYTLSPSTAYFMVSVMDVDMRVAFSASSTDATAVVGMGRWSIPVGGAFAGYSTGNQFTVRLVVYDDHFTTAVTGNIYACTLSQPGVTLLSGLASNRFKKVAYIGWWATEGNKGPLSLFTTYTQNVPSGTHLNLPFVVFEAGNTSFTKLVLSSPVDGWMGGINGSDPVTDAQRASVRDTIKVMASFGGFYLTGPDAAQTPQVMSNVWPGLYLIAGDPSHPYNNTDAFASDLVALFTTSGGVQIDGFDLDVEGIAKNTEVQPSFVSYTGETIPVESAAAYYNTFAAWLGNLSKSLKSLSLMVTHAPQTPYFHEDYGNVYNVIEHSYGEHIDFYNIQYYNQGPNNYYVTYNDVFEFDMEYHASVNELVAAGIPVGKVVVGKPVPTEDFTPSPDGVLNLWSADYGETTMTTIVGTALHSSTPNVQGWSSDGGLMVWFWQNSGQSVAGDLPITAEEENTQIKNYFATV